MQIKFKKTALMLSLISSLYIGSFSGSKIQAMKTDNLSNAIPKISQLQQTSTTYKVKIDDQLRPTNFSSIDPKFTQILYEDIPGIGSIIDAILKNGQYNKIEFISERENISGDYHTNDISLLFTFDKNTIKFKHLLGYISNDNNGELNDKEISAYNELLEKIKAKIPDQQIIPFTKNLIELEIPEGIKSIGEKFCYNATPEQNPIIIERLIIPKSLISTGTRSFKNCNKLSLLVFPSNCSNLKELSRSCFVGCTNLKKIEIPASVTIMQSCVFKKAGLESVVIPKSLAPNGLCSNAFCRCPNLKTVHFDDASTFLPSHCFNGCSNLTGIVLPSNLVEIKNALFFDCTNLKKIEIPDGVTYIGEKSFDNCKSLEAIDFKESKESKRLFLALSCFENCEKLESINIPSTVTELTLGEKMINGCTNLKELNIPSKDAIEPPLKPMVFSARKNDEKNQLTIKIGDETYGNKEDCRHRFADIYTSYGTLCRDNIELLTQNGEDISKIEEITIPDGIRTIDPETFKGLKKLKKVNIGNVQKIRNEAFSNCENLEEIIFNETSKNDLDIGYKAFYNCKNLKKVNIPNNIRSLGDYAFSGCSDQLKIIYNNIEYSLGDFYYKVFGILCKDNRDIILNGQNPNTIEEIKIPDDVEKISEQTFDDLTNLKTVYIGKNVKDVGIKVFLHSEKLEKLVFDKDTRLRFAGNSFLFIEDPNDRDKALTPKNLKIFYSGREMKDSVDLRKTISQKGKETYSNYGMASWAAYLCKAKRGSKCDGAIK